ncbi:MAG TPA: hypothetical protein PK176_16775, partial [Acidobacteriota bacterium]|nr:hypothetical protein [Acidobacteriota bacterium]HQM64968.1 hypothetical protein [Acidobacteriota bacterium]
RIAIEDKAGSERILMHVPNRKAYIRIGAPNDPPPGGGPPEPPTTPPPTTAPTPSPHDDEMSKELSKLKAEVDGIKAEMEGDLEFKCHNKKETISGNSFTMVIGAEESFYLGNYTHVKFITAVDISIALDFELKIGAGFELDQLHHTFFEEKTELGLLKNAMNTTRLEMDAQLTQLRSDQNVLVGEVAQLAGETNQLALQSTQMATQVSNLSGQVSTLAGVTNTIKGSVTGIQGQQSTLLGENLTTVVNESTLVGNRTTTIGTNTNLVAEHTDLNGQHCTLAGLQILI